MHGGTSSQWPSLKRPMFPSWPITQNETQSHQILYLKSSYRAGRGISWQSIGLTNVISSVLPQEEYVLKRQGWMSPRNSCAGEAEPGRYLGMLVSQSSLTGCAPSQPEPLLPGRWQGFLKSAHQVVLQPPQTQPSHTHMCTHPLTYTHIKSLHKSKKHYQTNTCHDSKERL